jgi:hypothetical protein
MRSEARASGKFNGQGFVLDDGIAIAERGAVVRDDNAFRRLHAFSQEGPCMLADV